MVAIGVEQWKAEAMLVRAGKTFSNEANASIAGVTTLLEPMIMIFLGGIASIIVLAVLLPMTAELMQNRSVKS
jgi:type IV pilus assembly protein PilC